MLPVLIVAIVFSVPLAAIIGAFWVKVKRMEFEAGARDVEPRLRALEAENRELRQRVEVLETIATDDEPQRLRTRVRVEPAATAAAGEPAESAAPAAQSARRAG